MKKNISWLALVLALSMVLSGCSGKEPQRGSVTPGPAPTAKAPETTQAPEATASEETEVPQETKAPDISLGHMVGGTYENTYAGLGCTLDDNWTYYTPEELQEASGVTQEMLKDTELMENNKDNQQFFDMMAQNETDLTMINIGYNYISLQERLATALLTEEQLVDSVISQKDMMANAYAQSGITLKSMERVKVNFLGQERHAVYSEATIAGEGFDIPYYILQVFQLKPGGSYYVTLTLASYMEDNTQGLLDLFYPVSE